MSKITGREEIFKGLNLGEDVIGLINKSQTLVDQIHKYNKDVLAENVRPIEVDVDRVGIFWSSIEKGIYLGRYGDAGYEALDPRVFVGILSHELGHYINDARDKAREQFYADKVRDNYDIAAFVGITKEAEAAYNNWKIAREIYENNRSLISVLGDRPDYVSAPGYDIYHMLTKVYDANVGKMSADMLEKAMMEVAGSYLAQASPGANLNVNYYEYYGSAYGASPKRLSHAPVAAVDYSVDFETGLMKSVTLHFSTGMRQTNQYDRGLLSTAALCGPNGQIVEYARYAANGLKTEEIIYDSIGNGTITRTDTNGDGVFDHVKKETRLADGASVIREDTNGDGVADRNFIVNGGQRYDLSNVRDAAFADSLLSRYRASGLLSGTSYLDLSQVISRTLTYGGKNDYGFTMPSGWYNPIGAFYEAKSLELDTAASIANKTPVLLNAQRQGLSAETLRSLDTNRDGKLSGAELNGLQVWVDMNEDGIADAGEFRALHHAGISEIRAVDFDIVTRGNSRYANGPDTAPLKGSEVAGQPGRIYLAPAVPFSNYRALRDTDNTYWINSSQFIHFGARQIKINNGNRTYLIGTDGNDVFDANYYAAYGHWINSGLLVNFLAGGGDDVMGGSWRNDNLWGGTGNDTLFGYDGDDRLYGEEGDDELQGGAGNDVLDGGSGNDSLFGQAGNDIMNGGDGDDIMMGFTASNEAKQALAPGETDDDVMYGGAGNDRMWGGLGNDYMDGGDGADLVRGGHGNDTIFGGTGNDELHGDEGNDRLLGEAGHDRIFGEAGDDVIWGGDGDDVLVGFTADNDAKQTLSWGETDNDALYGGNGNDALYGGLGNDYLDGGNDDDFLDGGEGDDTLFGGAGSDELNGGNGNDVLSGETGNDKIFGGAGNDTIWGGDGDDILVGFTATNDAKQSLAAWETDDDTIYGGAGNDLILGGLGNDLLYGEAGNDEIQGGAGHDRLYGGDGNDRLFGQVGNDILYGGAGDDLLVGFTGDNEEKRTLAPGETDDDYLYGGDGRDTLLGGLGNDYLDGGAGADHMEGGQGNDTYIVNSVNDVILEYANEGYDTVISSANYILNANIEELRLVEGFDINGTGNALDNVIVGNSADNILDGVTGADTMIGGKGNDTYYVDNVGDRVVERAGEGIDTVQSKISYALGDHVENLNLLDFGKPEKGLVDGTSVLVYGYPKANELDYMQGDAVPTFQGTCALTSIANLLTQIGTPTTEGEVVRRAINNQWAITSPAATDYQRGGSNYVQQQALLKSYGITNNLLAGYDEHAVANLVRSGRGVILALNAGRLWGDGAYLDSGGVNHVVTVTGAVYGEADGVLKGFYIADSGRQRVSDMTRYVSLQEFRSAANVPNSYAIYTAEALKLWNEDIDGTGNALDNTIIGNRGNNVLDGGAGNDILVGGLGNDTYRFGRGAGRDTIQDDDETLGNNDVISIGAGVSADQLWFRHVGNDLEISILGSSDTATVRDWYSGSRYQIEQIRLDDGRTLVNADVEKLVQAMAAWSPPGAGSVTLSPEHQAALAPTLATSWR
ncbi:Hemolysin-type calcium-binding region [Burkholderia ambifaria MC40-6]|uniref:Hemolysin-type calcium-binding region n=1 Tax=Burkholderia ambifaria (strain MC40-6) TaxID=398577 RepID=B1Z0Q1_BURA4|nr:calcium-binding protein [Burkholderia ambifaria]ACB67603.1 Hemolysin-type calcium-binding region [Burkholderia ambifaria MC40-6]